MNYTYIWNCQRTNKINENKAIKLLLYVFEIHFTLISTMLHSNVSFVDNIIVPQGQTVEHN